MSAALSPAVLLSVARKELAQLGRDPRMLALALVTPVVQLVLFGYAATFDLRDVPVVVVDEARDPRSAELIRAIDPLPGDGSELRVAGHAQRPHVDRAFARGDAAAVVVLPRSRGDRPAPVAVWVDGSDANTATIARAALEQALLEAAAPSATPAIALEARVLYNPELRSANFMVPGVIALVLLVAASMLSALSIVKEKEGGTFEALLSTPLRPAELIGGKLLPFAALGLLDAAGVVAVGVAWFDVPQRGSWLLLLLFVAAFVGVSLALGLLLSTLVATQRQAMIVAFAGLIPMLLLSGFIFPVAAMPPAFQWAAELIPVKHVLEALRALCLRGAGLDLLWPQLTILTAGAAAILALALSRFRMRLG